jgi:hypothetical protein
VDSDLAVHRIGGGEASNLALKPAEAHLTPPGISVLLGGTPADAASEMRSAFPNATRLQQAAGTVGSATVARIRAAGFDVIAVPTRNLPNHGRIIHPLGAAGFTAENVEKLAQQLTNTTGL